MASIKNSSSNEEEPMKDLCEECKQEIEEDSPRVFVGAKKYHFAHYKPDFLEPNFKPSPERSIPFFDCPPKEPPSN